MAYPPAVPVATRTNTTPQVDNHPGDHNGISGALTDIINELGTGPKGTYPSLTQRLAAVKLVSAYSYQVNIANASGGLVDLNLPTVVATAPGWIEVDMSPCYAGFGNGTVLGILAGFYTNNATGADGGAYQSYASAGVANAGTWQRCSPVSLVFPVTAGNYVPTFRGQWTSPTNCYFQGLASIKLYSN
jgi:hypothetical protein